MHIAVSNVKEVLIQFIPFLAALHQCHIDFTDKKFISVQALLNILSEIQKLIAVQFHLSHIAPSITYSAVLICKGDSAEK